MVISNKPLQFIIAILIACLPVFGLAQNHSESTPAHTETTAVAHEATTEVKDETSEIREQIKEVIAHHVLDGHEFSIFGDKETGAHYGFPLPIILWDNGVHIFSSSKFHHGEAVAESNGNYYKLHHEKIYKTDAAGTLTEEHGHPTNAMPIDLSITKVVTQLFLSAILLKTEGFQLELDVFSSQLYYIFVTKSRFQTSVKNIIKNI